MKNHKQTEPTVEGKVMSYSFIERGGRCIQLNFIHFKIFKIQIRSEKMCVRTVKKQMLPGPYVFVE